MSIAGNGTVILWIVSGVSQEDLGESSARNVRFLHDCSDACGVGDHTWYGSWRRELSSGGPGLMFIYLINVFNGMAGGKIVGIVFYICVLFAVGSESV